MAEGLDVLFNFQSNGFTKTRVPRLDPPVRVTDIYKTSFAMPDPSLHITWSPLPDAIWHRSWPTVPERWPAKPPQNWESYFNVKFGVKDAAGAEFDVRVPYKRFAENRGWAKALDLSVTQFCASKALWYYIGPTYNKEHLNFARVEAEAAERKRLEDLRAEAREQRMLGNFEAADQRAAEYEAQQRAARGPWIVEVDDEPAAPSYTPEEFAEMQAALEAARADRERKRQAAEGLVYHDKRRRNN